MENKHQSQVRISPVILMPVGGKWNAMFLSLQSTYMTPAPWMTIFLYFHRFRQVSNWTLMQIFVSSFSLLFAPRQSVGNSHESLYYEMFCTNTCLLPVCPFVSDVMMYVEFVLTTVSNYKLTTQSPHARSNSLFPKGEKMCKWWMIRCLRVNK